ncbi:hypothetical protein VAEKB19_5970001 [Vibrio aestuarianus]|nr:hypothetical protein VAEKB19_5970001 [Vibrio aestuarianus]
MENLTLLWGYFLARWLDIYLVNVELVHNKKFKSDSQRLAVSLQASLVFMANALGLVFCVVHTLMWRYVLDEFLRLTLRFH